MTWKRKTILFKDENGVNAYHGLNWKHSNRKKIIITSHVMTLLMNESVNLIFRNFYLMRNIKSMWIIFFFFFFIAFRNGKTREIAITINYVASKRAQNLAWFIEMVRSRRLLAPHLHIFNALRVTRPSK